MEKSIFHPKNSVLHRFYYVLSNILNKCKCAFYFWLSIRFERNSSDTMLYDHTVYLLDGRMESSKNFEIFTCNFYAKLFDQISHYQLKLNLWGHNLRFIGKKTEKLKISIKISSTIQSSSNWKNRQHQISVLRLIK